MKVYRPHWWTPLANSRFRKKRIDTMIRFDHRQIERAIRLGRCVNKNCRELFTRYNPHGGGGQCSHCWASWGA
jgi:hypothetical protein